MFQTGTVGYACAYVASLLAHREIARLTTLASTRIWDISRPRKDLRSLLCDSTANDRAAEQFAGKPYSTGRDLQDAILRIQRFLGRGEMRLDLHKPIAERAADTGDPRLATAVRTNARCRARDRRESAIRAYLTTLYG